MTEKKTRTKKKLLTVRMTRASGSVLIWHGTGATIYEEDGKHYLNVFESKEAGTFGIELPNGATVEITS